ncbi:hypothetical protein PR048_029320 [Dryococelus australis]|uniref:Uncharacterized protein n=1 Tax=Dryococelus australis TaxID=614101 RepID=A0ABQ9GG19_9NEOP|nr:hypothetical protein PR048_029320 [Dryococelus australis]
MPIPRSSSSQLDNGYAHFEGTATPFRICERAASFPAPFPKDGRLGRPPDDVQGSSRKHFIEKPPNGLCWKSHRDTSSTAKTVRQPVQCLARIEAMRELMRMSRSPLTLTTFLGLRRAKYLQPGTNYIPDCACPSSIEFKHDGIPITAISPQCARVVQDLVLGDVRPFLPQILPTLGQAPPEGGACHILCGVTKTVGRGPSGIGGLVPDHSVPIEGLTVVESTPPVCTDGILEDACLGDDKPVNGFHSWEKDHAPPPSIFLFTRARTDVNVVGSSNLVNIALLMSSLHNHCGSSGRWSNHQTEGLRVLAQVARIACLVAVMAVGCHGAAVGTSSSPSSAAQQPAADRKEETADRRLGLGIVGSLASASAGLSGSSSGSSSGDPDTGYGPPVVSTHSSTLILRAVILLASRQGDPGSIPGRAAPGFPQVGIVPDDATGRRVFSGSPIFPTLEFQHCSILTSFHPHSALKTSMLWAMVAERLACSPPTKAILVQSLAGSLLISACRNRAGRCRWSADFLGYLPFPPPFHSGATPYPLQLPPSALKTSMLRAVQISSLTQNFKR